MTTFSDIDMRAIEAIRGAAYFTATLAYGRGGYRVEERPTVLTAMMPRARSNKTRAPIPGARSFTLSRPMVTPRCLLPSS
jgi:hypothetical protein